MSKAEVFSMSEVCVLQAGKVSVLSMATCMLHGKSAVAQQWLYEGDMRYSNGWKG